MDHRKNLIDTSLLAIRRERAKPEALFLQKLAADEVQDRLNTVNRSFMRPAVVTPFPSVWDGRLGPDATIITDADTLDLQSEAHDLVVHSLGLHWSNDPVGQLIQCRRALNPDGLLLALTLGGQTLHQLRTALAEAEVAEMGGLSPRVAPMGEIRDLGALLQRAGLALPVADSAPIEALYDDMWHLMRDLRAMGETNVLTGRLRKMSGRGFFERATEIYRNAFGKESGKIRATFEIVVLTGWSPDASQQQPLRPGSAQARLAEALESTEIPLSD
ncbi:MAG: methyltransferase domain-containing protein [Pseudomonadota bacterium]